MESVEIRIERFKEDCRTYYKEVYAKYKSFYDKEIYSVSNDIYDRSLVLKELSKNVNSTNIDEFEKKLSEFKAEFNELYGIEDSKEVSVMEDPVEEHSVATVSEENKPKPIKKKGKGVRGLIIALAALIGLGATGYGCYQLGKNSNQETVIIVDDDTNEEENQRPVTSEEANAISEKLAQESFIVDEGYHEFTNVHDNEQLMQRAQDIFDNIFAPNYSKLTTEQKRYVTVENIANVIRGMNGIPQVDEDGNYYNNGNIGDQILNNAAFFLINAGSSTNSQYPEYYNVPAHLFTADNSDLSRFLRGYDEQYEAFSTAMNNRDGAACYQAGANIATKVWNEWHMCGVLGDQNPYQLSPEQLYLARMASVDKFGTYVYEYEQNAMTAICVDVCVDYNTKQLSSHTADEIITAVQYDLWDKPVARSAGMEDQVQFGMTDAQVFYNNLINEINYQYENVYKGKSVNSGMSLIRH